MPLVVISPYNVVDFPEGGGHFWVYMQYALGLRQLGCEVYWLEQFHSTGDEESDGIRLAPFLARMERFGMGGKLILYPQGGSGNAKEAAKNSFKPVGPKGRPAPGSVSRSRTYEGSFSKDLPQRYAGLSQAQAEAIFDRADLLLNFHYAIAPALLARFRRTALVDIDPGLLQFWISRGQLFVPTHDVYFTTGETVGTPAARFPDCGLKWNRIRPPVCLERWPFTFDPRAEAFTTVSCWDGGDWIVDGKEVVYENTKRMSYMEFAELPRLTGQCLELALFLRTQKDAEDRRYMETKGWRIRHSREVVCTPEAYQAYIQGSRGEFSCVKPSCIRFQNAWISDRTLCYLASGKPAVEQNTGQSCFLPNGEGMFRFSRPQEVAQAFEAINKDYEKHCRAARQIAETFFDAKQVVAKILSDGLSESKCIAHSLQASR